MGELSKGSGISSIRGGDFELGASGVSVTASSDIVVEDITPITLMPLVDDLGLVLGAGSATFTRSTIGTFVDKDDGLIKTAAIDAARFEQNGVLIEDASTNQLTRSEEFDDAAWSKTRLTVTADNSVAPDGATTMDLLIPTSDNLSHFLLQDSSITTGNKHTQVIYAKSGGYDFIQITGSTAFAENWVNVDVSDGSVGNSALGTASVVVTDMGAGVFRIAFTDTSTSTASGRFLIAIINADINSRLPAFIGDTVSGVNLWGGGLEQLSFASSYIKTTSVAVTRTADNLIIAGQASNWNDSEGSVSCIANSLGDTAANQSVWSSSIAGSDDDRHRVLLNNNHKLQMFVEDGDVVQVSAADADDFNDNANNKVAYTYKVNDFKLYNNSIEVASDSSGTLPTSIDEIAIGRRNTAAEQFFGHIKDFRIYDVALTAAQVAAI